MKKNIKQLLIIALFLLSLPVLAAKTDLLMLLPGFPGTTAQAQPYVDKMLRHLEKDLTLEPNSMSGVFIPDAALAADKLNTVKPGIALLGPSVYAQNHKKYRMTVIAKLYANGRAEQTYYLITTKSGPANLKQLAGKKISGQIVNDPKFVKNVLLDKKAPGNLTFISQKRPLKSLRDLVKGKVDAALIDEATKDQMSQLSFANDLQIIFTTSPVPAPAVVVLDNAKKDLKKIKTALTGLCKKADGKSLCKSLTITSISPATNNDYKALLKKYNR